MRITLAEDSALLREGIAQMLIAEGHEIVDAVGSGVELLEVVAVRTPDLVIVDVRMPPNFVDEGIRAALEIRRMWSAVGVLVLSQYVESRHATELLTGAGGVGYLLKDRVTDVAEFLGAVERVGSGGTAFDQEVIRRLLAKSPDANRLATLTEREREVLGLMAQGYTNTAMRDRLYVSQSAIEKHINAIFSKLGLPERGAYSRRVLAVLEFLRDP